MTGRERPAGQGEHTPVWVRDTAAAPDPGLDRETIVRAAIELADTHGLASVTIRRIAQALQARPMSLYQHVPSKQDLLDLMFDEIAALNLFEDALPRRPRAALSALAHRTREVGLAHPWSIDVANSRPQLGPNTMRVLNEWTGAAMGLCSSEAAAWAIFTAVNDYVVGYTTREAARRRMAPKTAAEAKRWQGQIDTYLRQLADEGHLGNIESLLRQGYAAQDDNFVVGLDWLLDSIERQAPGGH